jgi:GT2 family glycosyltransferase
MRFQHLDDETQARADARGVVAVDYACGCALLARSAVLRKVGLLERRFFLTYEDTDLCYRARRAGFACYYVPAAVLWHKISTSFGGAESPLFVYFMTRNLMLWGERHLSRGELLRLYGSVWRELKRGLLAKRGGDGAAGLRSRLREPRNRAMAWGMLHYALRRFGDAPERLRRSLARPSPRPGH